MERNNWDDYFMSIARTVATRATCDRKHVGCVIVKDKMVLASGYNGSIAGELHCDQIGHDIVDGHCVRTIHSEINAILQAAKHGVSINGASIYVTAFPCWNCFKAISNAGIKAIYYEDGYRVDERVIGAANNLKISLNQVFKNEN